MIIDELRFDGDDLMYMTIGFAVGVITAWVVRKVLVRNEN